MNAYLILDIGTGNVRVALVNTAGKLLHVERGNVVYKKDDKYKEALYFEPEVLWACVSALIDKVLDKNKGADLIAVTASSQREGIVLLDKAGKSIIGFPNHDHRGRFMEEMIKDKDAVYRLTGRYPSSLFSALKLVAYREKYPETWEQVGCFMSISDWAQYQLSGIKGYEHAQASETLLYDVENKCWSDELLSLFNLGKSMVPPLYFSGSRLGEIKKEYTERFHLPSGIPVFVGGADTQLAIKSTRPEPGDVVIVSGTTTPVVNISTTYILDAKQRSWTNSHLDKAQYIVETNCGVTGLNYQRIKQIFYPNDSYETIETELDDIKTLSCLAHLGSFLADEKAFLTRGGFLFDVPIMTELSRADFAFAALWDIACSIKENMECLTDILDAERDYAWCCGGGFQSRNLRKFVAGLIQKKLYLQEGYEQASVSGAAVICEEALGYQGINKEPKEVIMPENTPLYQSWYGQWKSTRNDLMKIN